MRMQRKPEKAEHRGTADRQTQRKRYSLPLPCPLCRWVCAGSLVREALGREQSSLLQRQPPARGESHTPAPLPSPSSSSSSAAQSRSLLHPAKPYSSLNPAGWGLAAQPAPTAHAPAALPKSPPDQHVPLHPLLHPPGSKTPASPPLEMGDRSARAADAKGWQGASGGGGCL